jgi:PTS system ascorbate-specific IIA component
MAGILIVAHTPIASAILEFVEHVYSSVPDQIFAIDVSAHEDAKVITQRLLERIEQMQSSSEVLILTDIMGATPSNVASKLSSSGSTGKVLQIVTGLNLPMLLRAISHRHEPLDEIVEKALQGGQQGVIRIRDLSKAIP